MIREDFRWPDGKAAAISLTFDDARLTQVEAGLPILDEHGVKATFYVSFASMEKRLDDWERAVADGHEIGNHTVNHPCSCNFGFARDRALEDYTLERMKGELNGANDYLERTLGIRPTTFAYPCGQTFVGRGPEVKSYVPLVAQQFDMGRLYRSESHFSPTYGDLAQAMGVEFDGMTLATARELMEKTVLEGGWLIFAGHEIGSLHEKSVSGDTLHGVCDYVNDPANGLWIDTAANVAAFIKARTGG